MIDLHRVHKKTCKLTYIPYYGYALGRKVSRTIRRIFFLWFIDEPIYYSGEQLALPGLLLLFFIYLNLMDRFFFLSLEICFVLFFSKEYFGFFSVHSSARSKINSPRKRRGSIVFFVTKKEKKNHLKRIPDDDRNNNNNIGV